MKEISPYTALAKALRRDKAMGGKTPVFRTDPFCMTCKLARNYGGVGGGRKPPQAVVCVGLLIAPAPTTEEGMADHLEVNILWISVCLRCRL